MSEIKTVALLGAGGNLGPAILKQFLASDFKTTVLTRESSKSTFPSEVKVVKTDYSAESLATVFAGQDAVISIVGSEGFAAQKTMIDAAEKAGVKRFIPSEFTSDTANPELRKIVPFFEGKKGVVDYLKSKESNSFSWTALITSAFFDWGLKVGFLGVDFKNQKATTYDGGNSSWTATTLSTIGLALVKALSPENAAATANQYVYISSFTTTSSKLISTAEKLSGKKFTVEDLNARDVTSTNLEKLGKGDFSAVGPLLLASCLGNYGFGDLATAKGGLWNERLGLPKEDFESTVKAVWTGEAT